MKKLLVWLTGAVMVLGFAPSAAAVEVTAHVNGGGNGSWDPLGIESASQFGFGARGVELFEDGAAEGQFECVMAGRSEFPLFQMMMVHGRITSGALVDFDPFTLAPLPPGTSAAVLQGKGTLYGNMDGGGPTTKHDIVFTVELREGNATPGPTQGMLRLSGGPDPTGDDPGAPPFTFPPEYVTAGLITIHLSPNLG